MENFNLSDYVTFAGILVLDGLIFTQLNRVGTNLKSNLNAIKSEFKSDFSNIRSKFKSDLSDLKSDLNDIKEDIKLLQISNAERIDIEKGYEKDKIEIATLK